MDIIQDLFINAVKAIFEFALGLNKDMTTTTGNLLNNGWNSLLPGSDSIVNTITSVSNSVVMPIGLSLLTLALLIQLVKISERIDGTQAMPAIKEIFIFFAIATIFTYLIRHSMEICKGLFALFSNVANDAAFKAMSNSQITSAINTISKNLGTTDDIGISFLVFIVGLIFLVASVIAFVVGIAAVIGRGLQLYVMSFFAPIPLSMLAIDETRQIGVGFLKNFAGLCLAGAIMALTLWIYPRLLTAALSSVSDAELIKSFSSSSAGTSTTAWLWEIIALNIVYVQTMMNSGQLAKDILGS